MKQSLYNTKWILTAALLVVLGTQYSYQTSSLDLQASAPNYGEFVLASKDSSDKTIVITTEANASVAGCTSGCTTVAFLPKSITVQEYADFLLKVKELETLKAQNTASTSSLTPPPAPSGPGVIDCPAVKPKETKEEREERKECEKEAKAELKREKEEAKAEKKQAKIDALVEKFEEKIEKLEEKCDGDLECLATGFTSTLSKFADKKDFPQATGNKAFNSLIAPQLKKALFSNPEAANAALQTLMQNMPDKYKNLKQTVIQAVQVQSKVAAAKVSAQYKVVNELSKQNDPQAYLEALQTTQQDHNNVAYQINAYSSSISESLQTVGDASTFDYYKKSYVPDMQKLLANIAGGNVQATTIDPKNTTRNDRTQNNGVNGTGSTADVNDSRKMTRDNNTWTVQTGNQGLQIGNPTNQSRGGRGPK